MRLDVLIEGAHAGSLELSHRGHAEFVYAADYLSPAGRTPLSVRFPRREQPYAGPAVSQGLDI